jgi:hypothetical protein
MWPVDLFDKLGLWIERRLGRRLKLNVYECVAGHVVRHYGHRRYEIPIGEISDWSVVSEMGFDVVHIGLHRGGAVQWIDTFGDLTRILRHEAGGKMRKGEW